MVRRKILSKYKIFFIVNKINLIESKTFFTFKSKNIFLNVTYPLITTKTSPPMTTSLSS